STTLRPLGPSVTRTASARMSTPRSIRARASPLKRTSLAAICSLPCLCDWTGLALRGVSVDHAHDVGFLHDQKVFAFDLDLSSRPLSVEDRVADLDAHRRQLAVLIASARPGRDDLALLGLFLGGVGNDDPALGLGLAVQGLDHDPVLQRTNLDCHR